MELHKVDVAIIGTGTAGMSAYRAALQHTNSVALIEGDQYGTTCARVGCMPSKLLIAAANAAHAARHTDLFGVHVDNVQVDGGEVLGRVRRERDRFVGFVEETVEEFDASHKFKGHARFLDPHRLQVGQDIEIEAKRIVIATGSRPNIPGFLQEADDRLLDNESLFELETLPQSVAVFGPGVIGLELGQALSRLGVRIRMFGVGGSVGPLQSDEIRDYALETFRSEFSLDPQADVKAVNRTEDGVSVTFLDEGIEITETFDYLLAATGRKPNVDSIDIEKADLKLDDRGVPEVNFYTLQCGTSHIFMAGDASNQVPLLHEAVDEGKIAGGNAGRYPDVQVGPRRTPLTIVFTEPQIGQAGRTISDIESDCRVCYATGEVSFDNQGRSRVMGVNKGLLKVYAEHGTGVFLGAEMFGPSAEHIAHLLAWCAQKRMTVSEMVAMPFYHPVIEEGLRTALRDLGNKLHLGPEMVQKCLDCGPGA